MSATTSNLRPRVSAPSAVTVTESNATAIDVRLVDTTGINPGTVLQIDDNGVRFSAMGQEGGGESAA